MEHRHHPRGWLRRRIGNASFILGAALIVAGAWLFADTLLFASCLVGGIALFAVADLILPFPGDGKRE